MKTYFTFLAQQALYIRQCGGVEHLTDVRAPHRQHGDPPAYRGERPTGR